MKKILLESLNNSDDIYLDGCIEDNYFNEIELDSNNIFFKEIKKYPVLTKEEERDLLIKVKSGDENSKNILVECNLKFVIEIAKRYKNKGVELVDLIQEGSLGLIKAIELYDINTDGKLSTYAYYWIRAYIVRLIQQNSSIISIPINVQLELQKINKVKKMLEEKFKRDVTNSELAKELNVPIEKLEEILKRIPKVCSLNDYVLINDSKIEFENIIKSEEDTPEEKSVKKITSEQIMDILSKCNLKERELDLLINRFGLCGKEEKSAKSIAELYNITESAVNISKQRIYNKIKKSSHSKELIKYLAE